MLSSTIRKVATKTLYGCRVFVLCRQSSFVKLECFSFFLFFFLSLFFYCSWTGLVVINHVCGWTMQCLLLVVVTSLYLSDHHALPFFFFFFSSSFFFISLQITELREQRAKEKLQKLEQRRAFRESRVFQEARSIGGVLNVVSVFRHSKRDIFLTVYNPVTGEKFQFNMRKDVMKEFLERSLNCGALPERELYIKSNMRLLADQLMYRRRMNEDGVRHKVIVLSDKGGGERGYLCARKGKMVGGRGCIISVFQYFKDFIFKAHDVETCEMMRTTLSDTQLKRWFQWTEDQPIPMLLRIENRKQLVAWFLERVFICRGCGLTSHRMAHQAGRAVLMLEYEQEEIRSHLMAKRIQGMYRTKKARDWLKKLLLKIVKKHWDPQVGAFYYVNDRTGAISWEKPKQLGDDLDIEDPPDVWEKLRQPDGKSFYYYHALTGRTSYLSEDEAATVIQKFHRKKQAAEFAIGDFMQIVRALRFQNDAEIKFKANPESLSAMINWALMCQTQLFDFTQAKTLYKKAFKMAPNNPVLLNAYALFTLADITYPREKTFVNAHEMMGEATSVDRDNAKFQIARQSFFHWSCVTNPNHPIAWLNWALIMQTHDDDFNKADRFYRKALGLKGFTDEETGMVVIAGDADERVLRNYEDFKKNRLPGGRYEGGGPSQEVVKRSLVEKNGKNFETEAPEWDFMVDPHADETIKGTESFWYNTKTAEAHWAEPKWDELWSHRRKASKYIKNDNGWEVFEDPEGRTFFYNMADGAYVWDTSSLAADEGQYSYDY